MDIHGRHFHPWMPFMDVIHGWRRWMTDMDGAFSIKIVSLTVYLFHLFFNPQTLTSHILEATSEMTVHIVKSVKALLSYKILRQIRSIFFIKDDIFWDCMIWAHYLLPNFDKNIHYCHQFWEKASLHVGLFSFLHFFHATVWLRFGGR